MLNQRAGMGYTYPTYDNVSASIENGSINDETWAQRLGRFCGHKSHHVKIYTDLACFKSELLPFYNELDNGRLPHVLPKTQLITKRATKAEIRNCKKMENHITKYFPNGTASDHLIVELLNNAKLNKHGYVQTYGNKNTTLPMLRGIPQTAIYADAKFRSEISGCNAPSYTLVSNQKTRNPITGFLGADSQWKQFEKLRNAAINECDEAIFWSQSGQTICLPEGKYMYWYINVDDGSIIIDMATVTSFEHLNHFIGELTINTTVYYADYNIETIRTDTFEKDGCSNSITTTIVVPHAHTSVCNKPTIIIRAKQPSITQNIAV